MHIGFRVRDYVCYVVWLSSSLEPLEHYYAVSSSILDVQGILMATLQAELGPFAGGMWPLLIFRLEFQSLQNQVCRDSEMSS